MSETTNTDPPVDGGTDQAPRPPEKSWAQAAAPKPKTSLDQAKVHIDLSKTEALPDRSETRITAFNEGARPFQLSFEVPRKYGAAMETEARKIVKTVRGVFPDARIGLTVVPGTEKTNVMIFYNDDDVAEALAGELTGKAFICDRIIIIYRVNTPYFLEIPTKGKDTTEELERAARELGWDHYTFQSRTRTSKPYKGTTTYGFQCLCNKELQFIADKLRIPAGKGGGNPHNRQSGDLHLVDAKLMSAQYAPENLERLVKGVLDGGSINYRNVASFRNYGGQPIVSILFFTKDARDKASAVLRQTIGAVDDCELRLMVSDRIGKEWTRTELPTLNPPPPKKDEPKSPKEKSSPTAPVKIAKPAAKAQAPAVDAKARELEYENRRKLKEERKRASEMERLRNTERKAKERLEKDRKELEAQLEAARVENRKLQTELTNANAKVAQFDGVMELIEDREDIAERNMELATKVSEAESEKEAAFTQLEEEREERKRLERLAPNQAATTDEPKETSKKNSGRASTPKDPPKKAATKPRPTASETPGKQTAFKSKKRGTQVKAPARPSQDKAAKSPTAVPEVSQLRASAGFAEPDHMDLDDDSSEAHSTAAADDAEAVCSEPAALPTPSRPRREESELDDTEEPPDPVSLVRSRAAAADDGGGDAAANDLSEAPDDVQDEATKKKRPKVPDDPPDGAAAPGADPPRLETAAACH